MRERDSPCASQHRPTSDLPSPLPSSPLALWRPRVANQFKTNHAEYVKTAAFWTKTYACGAAADGKSEAEAAEMAKKAGSGAAAAISNLTPKQKQVQDFTGCTDEEAISLMQRYRDPNAAVNAYFAGQR